MEEEKERDQGTEDETSYLDKLIGEEKLSTTGTETTNRGAENRGTGKL